MTLYIAFSCVATVWAIYSLYQAIKDWELFVELYRNTDERLRPGYLKLIRQLGFQTLLALLVIYLFIFTWARILLQ